MPTERTDIRRTELPQGRRISRQAPKALDAESLFAGSRELRVIYKGEEYRLRITRNDKLILTK